MAAIERNQLHAQMFVQGDGRNEMEVSMRRILLMLLTSAAIGVVGTAGVSAAPIDGGAVGKASDSVSNVTQVQHWRWGSGGHWRWGSRGWRRW